MSQMGAFDEAAGLTQEPPQAAGPKLDEEKSASQGRLIFRRFTKNWLAMAAVAIYLIVWLFSVSAIGIGPIPGWWHENYKTLYPLVAGGGPSAAHPFGQDTVGKDYFALVMRGIQNSVLVMVVYALVSTVIGVVVGAVAGYFRGWVDQLLMRITDMFIVIPGLVLALVVGNMSGGYNAFALALLLGAVGWMIIARLVRAEFLSLREREFVEAARVAGASDMRIIFKHILPNAIGVIIVASTLSAAVAILLETALSFLGYGIKSPDSSLGLLISLNQQALTTRPWLFWWPGLFIVLLALLVNFVGDGLREAFDPRSKRVNLRRTKDRPDAVLPGPAGAQEAVTEEESQL